MNVADLSTDDSVRLSFESNVNTKKIDTRSPQEEKSDYQSVAVQE